LPQPLRHPALHTLSDWDRHIHLDTVPSFMTLMQKIQIWRHICHRPEMKVYERNQNCQQFSPENPAQIQLPI
jgi:hypothetical protein